MYYRYFTIYYRYFPRLIFSSPVCDLVRNFVALLVGLVLALGVGHLPEDGLALVAGHGHAHRHLRVPGSLDGDLVTHLRPGSRRHRAECHRAR